MCRLFIGAIFFSLNNLLLTQTTSVKFKNTQVFVNEEFSAYMDSLNASKDEELQEYIRYYTGNKHNVYRVGEKVLVQDVFYMRAFLFPGEEDFERYVAMMSEAISTRPTVYKNWIEDTTDFVNKSVFYKETLADYLQIDSNDLDYTERSLRLVADQIGKLNLVSKVDPSDNLLGFTALIAYMGPCIYPQGKWEFFYFYKIKSYWPKSFAKQKHGSSTDWVGSVSKELLENRKKPALADIAACARSIYESYEE